MQAHCFYRLAVPMLLLAQILVGVGPPLAQAQGPEFDYVLLIDTSGSMEGRCDEGPCEPIFADLKDVLTRFINSLPNGANVVLLPFDVEIDPLYLTPERISRFQHISSADQRAIEGEIDNLVADGLHTYIWDSLSQALGVMEQLREDDAKHFQLLLLVTDGRDEGSERSASEVLAEYEMHQVANPYMYGIYLALRDQPVPEEILEAEDFQSWTTDIPPIIQLVVLSPLELDYGSLLEGQQNSRSIVMWYTEPELQGTPFMVSVPSVDKPLPSGATLNIQPREFEVGDAAQSLTLSLVNWPEGAEEEWTGRIDLEDNRPEVFVVPEAIPFRFNTFPPCRVSVSAVSQDKAIEMGSLGTYPRDGNRIETTSEGILLEFADCPAETSVLATIEPTQGPAGLGTREQVRLQVGDGAPQESVNLDAAAEGFHVHVSLDEDVLSTLRPGATTVTGRIVLQQSGGDRSVAWEGLGEAANGDWVIPFQFNVGVVAPVVTVSLENPELGRTGSEPLLTTVRVSCDGAAQNAGTVVKASLVPAAENPFPLLVPNQLYLLSGPTAAAAAELEIDCGKAAEQGFLVAVAPAEIVGEGLAWNWPWQAHSFGGSVRLSSSPGVNIEGEELAFSFETQVPMPTGLVAVLALGAAAIIVVIALVLYSLLRPKFPHGLTVSVDGGPKKELRKLQGKGLFKGAVTVGSKKDDLDLGEGRTVGKLLPRRGRGCSVLPHTNEWSVAGRQLAARKKSALPAARAQLKVHGHSLRLETRITDSGKRAPLRRRGKREPPKGTKGLRRTRIVAQTQ